MKESGLQFVLIPLIQPIYELMYVGYTVVYTASILKLMKNHKYTWVNMKSCLNMAEISVYSRLLGW